MYVMSTSIVYSLHMYMYTNMLFCISFYGPYQTEKIAVWLTSMQVVGYLKFVSLKFYRFFFRFTCYGLLYAILHIDQILKYIFHLKSFE